MPTSRSNPSTILSGAAREILAPLGLFQVGRSRVWLDDHGWWLCVVEFQPSSWTKGSYLNVGCCWLWNVKDHVTFDEGSRIEGFNACDDLSEFQHVARQLSLRAASEVQRYRELFPDPARVAAYYTRHTRKGRGWAYDAGVAGGIAGDYQTARKMFEAFRSIEDNREWFIERAADAARLIDCLSDLQAFRGLIAERVGATRAALHLPDWSAVDFALERPTA